MNDFRCKGCGHLLAKEEILFGRIEIKCYACNNLNTFECDYPELREERLTVLAFTG